MSLPTTSNLFFPFSFPSKSIFSLLNLFLDETTFFRGSKTRKKRGGLHGSSFQNLFSSKILTFSLVVASLDKQSIRDPKVFAQLIKNSKKHNIPLLMKELKEDFHNGSTFLTFSPINHPSKVGFPNQNSAPISHPTPYSSDKIRNSLKYSHKTDF